MNSVPVWLTGLPEFFPLEVWVLVRGLAVLTASFLALLCASVCLALLIFMPIPLCLVFCVLPFLWAWKRGKLRVWIPGLEKTCWTF